MPPTQPIRVYVVDDERVIASTLEAILNMSGFYATAFTAPDEAISAAKLDCPSLLITDVAMPGMNGIELAIQLQTICTGCKILLFSGQASTSDLLEEARKQGRDFKLLSKPVHPADLLAAIREL
jgi:FixJ family two-component response regulator